MCVFQYVYEMLMPAPVCVSAFYGCFLFLHSVTPSPTQSLRPNQHASPHSSKSINKALSISPHFRYLHFAVSNKKAQHQHKWPPSCSDHLAHDPQDQSVDGRTTASFSSQASKGYHSYPCQTQAGFVFGVVPAVATSIEGRLIEELKWVIRKIDLGDRVKRRTVLRQNDVGYK